MRIVLDTNVLVSGFLYPFSSSGEIVRLTARGDLQLCYDCRIISEYKEVLLRAKFGFKPNDVCEFISQIESEGFSIISRPLPKRLPDPDDEPFLEAAIEGKVYCLVTGNLKHYPVHIRQNASVFSPAEFLEKYRKKS
jgi:uncharacterized protein